MLSYICSCTLLQRRVFQLVQSMVSPSQKLVQLQRRDQARDAQAEGIVSTQNLWKASKTKPNCNAAVGWKPFNVITHCSKMALRCHHNVITPSMEISKPAIAGIWHQISNMDRFRNIKCSNTEFLPEWTNNCKTKKKMLPKEYPFDRWGKCRCWVKYFWCNRIIFVFVFVLFMYHICIVSVCICLSRAWEEREENLRRQIGQITDDQVFAKLSTNEIFCKASKIIRYIIFWF